MISAVRYDDSDTRVERVQVRRHEGSTIAASCTELSRSALTDTMTAHTSFVTVTARPEDRAWIKGLWVRIVT